MSFRLKTVILVLAASIIPFVFVSFVFIYQLTSDSQKFVQTELKKQTEQTANMIEHEIRLIKNDLNATAEMEVMADIVTLDLDRRIYEVLSHKKEAFSIQGDYYVLDINGALVSSTNIIAQQGEKVKTDGMFVKEIKSSFGGGNIGFVCLDYKLKNLDKFLYSNAIQKITITQNIKAVKPQTDTFKVSAKIPSLPQYVVSGELGTDTSIEKAKEALFVYLVGGFLLVAAFAYIFASKIAKPILALSERVAEIADTKEYSRRLTTESNDEISKVSSAFNNLLEGIEEALENRLRLAEEKSKTKTLEEMAQKLSRYISPQLVESIFSGEQEAHLESKRKKLTIFFSDIVDFTTTTDTMEAEDLSLLLNHYLNEMSQIALKHGATIDKFMGDAVMLFFGDPKSQGDKEDAISCVRMSLQMRARLDELREYWLDKGITKPFRVRFGIHTGYCTVGNFGNEERMEYTIIGGSVNLASRIESKANPNQILISEETYLLVKDTIECRYIDTISVKGISADVKVYEAIYENSTQKDVFYINRDGFELKIDFKKVEDVTTLQKNLENAIEAVIKHSL